MGATAKRPQRQSDRSLRGGALVLTAAASPGLLVDVPVLGPAPDPLNLNLEVELPSK